MLSPAAAAIGLGLTLVLGVVGAGGAWWLRRRSSLSIRNLYAPAAFSVLLIGGAVAAQWWPGVLALTALAAPWVGAVAVGRRWRLSDLGAGEELRNHELGRRWIWEPRPDRDHRERLYLRGQGELVHERPWPRGLEYVSMTARREKGPRLPLGAGQHVMLVGATGAGKTTTARRLIATRTLVQDAAVLVLDQKGDPEDVEQMQRLAAEAGVPFILFDSQSPDTDRWQPLWGAPAEVAARAVESVDQSEPYYYDALRKHLNIVCNVLYAADRWPPSVPFLIDACQPVRYPSVAVIASRLGEEHSALIKRALGHGVYVATPQGLKDLSGGANRLEVALALATRQMVTPRITPDGQAVAVRLVEALKQRAVVMWRTHADTMPDEAAALSVLALADIHAATALAGVPWTLVLDEFGAVIKTAAERALASLQRGRSHDGQLVVITQSIADVEALTGQIGLLASLTDNFAAIVAHRQTSPESRDWLAKLMGTRALWQHTNATTGHGQPSGDGSARRVREFRIGSDVFGNLRRGEAVIYTPIAGEPTRCAILPIELADITPARIDPAGAQHECEIAVHPEESLPEFRSEPRSGTPDQAALSTQVPAPDDGFKPTGL
jgi:ABC-type cobalamin/Fe3+-siderophores transport system ATPase subunit